MESDAQRSLQFVRSTPGIAVALVGMSSAQHVRTQSGDRPESSAGIVRCPDEAFQSRRLRRRSEVGPIDLDSTRLWSAQTALLAEVVFLNEALENRFRGRLER